MPSTDHAPQTLYDKILAAHVVDQKLDGTILLYIGQHFSTAGCFGTGLTTPSQTATWSTKLLLRFVPSLRALADSHGLLPS